MPELPEQMYCSEQICVPPAFPYLLRQFAKAAIRTQPTDLLKWSLAYFRCLSLNIPPPVKPRLEYPVPRDHYGITPGWLKALLYQLQNNQTVSFKILWDRWTGACLEHTTLIQILCLGGFNDPFAIPWLRFVGLCAAHLTDDLTHSMILICEIMTEEPEGGSAMITLEMFTDLYKFLADIDASKPQVLKNMYFTDSLLSLWGEMEEKEAPKEIVVEAVSEEESIKTIESEESEEQVVKRGDSKEVISCPSIAGDDDYSMDYYIDAAKEDAVGEVTSHESLKEGGEGEAKEGEEKEAGAEEAKAEGEGEGEEEEEEEEAEGAEEEGSVKEDAGEEDKASRISGEAEGETKEETGELETSPEAKDKEFMAEKEITGSKEKFVSKSYESVDTVQETPRKMAPDHFEDEEALKEDLEKLRALQQEIPGEGDEELEKFKCKLIAEMPLSKSQEDAMAHFGADERRSGEESLKGEEEGEGEEEYEDVYVDPVSGIGPKVPEDLLKAVCDYMKDVSAIQHGMVMPRNIRHYNCPPLEVLHY